MAQYGDKSEPEILPPVTKSATNPQVTIVTGIQNSPSASLAQKSTVSKMKAWAWRVTAAWTWAHWLTAIFIGHDALFQTEAAIIDRFVALISQLGFAPGNPAYIPLLLKCGWILMITGFGASQLLGFFVYTVFSPLLGAGYLIFRSTIKTVTADSTVKKGKGLRPSVRNIPWIVAAAFSLFGWFLLYGSSNSARQIIAGLIFSAILFLSLVFRAFQRAKPIDQSERILFGGIATYASRWVDEVFKKFKDAPPKTKVEAVTTLSINSKIATFLRFFALLLRGRKGRERISAWVLIDYAFSLLVLGVAAVLFWALAIKFSQAPKDLALSSALTIAASHFLPGVTAAANLRSGWTDYGAAMTAWLLFVIYLGPAGSIISRNQEEVIKSARTTYYTLRMVTIKYGQYRHALKCVRDRFN